MLIYINMSDLEHAPIAPLSERWDGVPPGMLLSSTLETFDFDPTNKGHRLFRDAVDLLQANWNGDQFVGLLLHGDPGTGKSHAAIGLARVLHAAGAEVFYRYVPELGHQESTVAGWTAPRVLEHSYGRGSAQTTIVESTGETEEGVVTKTMTHTTTDDKGALIVHRDPRSVFPSYYEDGIPRNPKQVLILDDYKPAYRPQVRAAIEAAANAGALVIMTSNFGNVYQLAAPGEQDVTQVRLPYDAPADTQRVVREAQAREVEALTAAYLSRLVSGFLEIKFDGVDHRKMDSFWLGLVDRPDFLSD